MTTLWGGGWHVRLPWNRPPLMANDRGTQGNRYAVAKERAAVRTAVAALLRAQPSRPSALAQDMGAAVWLTWQTGVNGRRDSDNMAPTLKPCLDALVDAGWLPDDGGLYVRASSLRAIPRALDRREKIAPALHLSVYYGPNMVLPPPPQDA